MSCYTRHLREQMQEAGLTFDAGGKKEADRRIRVALGKADANCPEIWRVIKGW